METPGISRILSIIPSFNGENDIYNCLDSLRKSSFATDILLIDNASKDNTLKIIENNFKGVRIILNQRNLGFGKAINIGLNYGKKHGYDYLLVINQDARLEINTLAGMKKFADSLNKKDWALISPWNKDPNGNSEYYFMENLEKRSGGHFEISIGNFAVIPVDFINAACWLINAKALEKLKGFDKRFFMYGEDLDFCKRAKYLGYKMFVMKDVYCVHNKIKGDYESDPQKILELKIGEDLAWYLDPANSLPLKLGRFLKINLACIKLSLRGKYKESSNKFRVNTAAVLRTFNIFA